ncbi:MAG: hypothetical protein AAB465_01555 [Patescibacteria group bacterium]
MTKEFKAKIEAIDPRERIEHLEDLQSTNLGIIEKLLFDELPEKEDKNREKLLEVFANIGKEISQEQQEILNQYQKEAKNLIVSTREELNKVGDHEIKAIDPATPELSRGLLKEMENFGAENLNGQEVVLINELPLKDAARKAPILFRQLGGNKFLRFASLFLALSTIGAIFPFAPARAETPKEDLTGGTDQKDLREKFPRDYPSEKLKVYKNSEKYNNASDEEKVLWEAGANLADDLEIGVYLGDGGIFRNFKLALDAKIMKEPVKIDGKLYSMNLDLPVGYELKINGLSQARTFRSGKNMFFIGQEDCMGSLDAVSQEQSVELDIYNPLGELVGKLLFEQMPTFKIGSLPRLQSLQNGEISKDSIGIYATDIDTMQTFKKLSHEQLVDILKESAVAVSEIENYFDYNLGVDKIYIGSDTEQENAFFSQSSDPNAVFMATDILLEQSRHPESRKLNRLLSRHEFLHKLDYMLGPENVEPEYRWLSCRSEFNNLFQEERADLERLQAQKKEPKTDKEKAEFEEQIKNHFLYVISEEKFFNDRARSGHPQDHAREFFVSLLNSVFEDETMRDNQIKSLSKENQQKYLKSLRLVEKILRDKGIDTSNLQKDIVKIYKFVKID